MEQPGKKRMGRPPSGKARLRLILSMRGSEPWGEWLGSFADSQGSDVSGLVDRALAELAQRLKYEPPPPRT